jgi:hypothetical protein
MPGQFQAIQQIATSEQIEIGMPRQINAFIPGPQLVAVLL